MNFPLATFRRPAIDCIGISVSQRAPLRCIFFGRQREEKSIVGAETNSIEDDNAIREAFFDWQIARRENWANKKQQDACCM